MLVAWGRQVPAGSYTAGVGEGMGTTAVVAHTCTAEGMGMMLVVDQSTCSNRRYPFITAKKWTSQFPMETKKIVFKIPTNIGAAQL